MGEIHANKLGECCSHSELHKLADSSFFKRSQIKGVGYSAAHHEPRSVSHKRRSSVAKPDVQDLCSNSEQIVLQTKCVFKATQIKGVGECCSSWIADRKQQATKTTKTRAPEHAARGSLTNAEIACLSSSLDVAASSDI